MVFFVVVVVVVVVVVGGGGGGGGNCEIENLNPLSLDLSSIHRINSTVLVLIKISRRFGRHQVLHIW